MFKKRKQALALETVPRHIAFITDGNGRWAKKRGLPRLAGHNAGTEAVKRIVKESQRLGVGYITFYAFSTENWKRPQEEVSGLMNLMVRYIQSELDELHANNVKLSIIGDLSGIPKGPREAVEGALERTRDNDGLRFTIALNYGGRDEILQAARRIAASVKAGELDESAIDEAVFSEHLYTCDLPDPDLVIRTSGEVRVSNFLLWQIAYSELLFLDMYWPDFDEWALQHAISQYNNRSRRFGSV